MTGDPKRIEDVLVRVGLLVEPIEQVGLGLLMGAGEGCRGWLEGGGVIHCKLFV